MTQITMQNGTTQEFTPKRKMNKVITINQSGDIVVELSFINGVQQSFTISESDLYKFAVHGASAKFSEVFNNEDDLEDGINATEEFFHRLTTKGEWSASRARGEGKGGSMLVQAIKEVYGYEVSKIREFLEDKTHAQKMAMLASAELKPVVDRLKAEKAAKGKNATAGSDLLSQLVSE